MAGVLALRQVFYSPTNPSRCLFHCSDATGLQLSTLGGLADRWYLCAMALGIWITGAFHEDGFADFCDGMGGGWTTDQVLRIMKDSYLGTFGVLGLITSFLLKGNALLLLEPSQVPLALVLMHSYPRFGAVLLQNISSYVQRDEHSKMRLLAAPHSPWRLVVAGLASVVLAALLVEGIFLLGFLVGGFVIVLLMRRYLNKRLGGYTGDCLGALEQILELFVVLWLALF